MKGQTKRFANHKGEQYGVEFKRKAKENIGFFDLWRYATFGERVATGAGVALSWLCSLGLVAAVAVYGELTALFVRRHRADASADTTLLLRLMGGGEPMPAGNRSAHMETLLRDSAAFALVSVVILAVTLVAASAAVTLANWAAARMVRRLVPRSCLDTHLDIYQDQEKSGPAEVALVFISSATLMHIFGLTLWIPAIKPLNKCGLR